MDLNNYRSFFFDLDRTLWNWDSTLTGAEDLVETLVDTGRNVGFHTDNTLLSRKAYAEKLSSMGMPAEEDQVITSGYVAGRVLERKGVDEVYAVGEQGLVEELENRGISISEEASNAVLGFDRSFGYEKLSRLKHLMDDGGKLYTCSTETVFQRQSESLPHQGAFNSAMKNFGDVRNVGKPTQAFRDSFKNYFEYFPGKSIFIGDRLEDVKTGNELGMTTAAVLSGEITEKKLENVEGKEMPDYVLTSLHKLRRRII